MIGRFLKILRDLPGPENGKPAPESPQVAAAALLVHVMNADGVRHDAELAELKAALGELWDLAGGELDQVAAAGEDADREAVDLYAFTRVLMRALDEEARAGFIGQLWEVAYADGERHEMEESVVWRIAELLGVDARQRILIRQRVEAARRG